jgi:hypothetical protein
MEGLIYGDSIEFNNLVIYATATQVNDLWMATVEYLKIDGSQARPAINGFDYVDHQEALKYANFLLSLGLENPVEYIEKFSRPWEGDE